METKKYIIEIPDNTAWLQLIKVSDKDGHVYFDFKDTEDLIPYTEPNFDAVRNEAYNEAYDKGYQDAVMKIGSNEQVIAEKAYQGGLIDAWDAAKKIVLSTEDGGLFDYDVRKSVFGCGNYMALKKYSASEAIEKIRQYEQEQEEIQFWDEVINGRNFKGTVTGIEDDGMLTIFCQDGTWVKSHARFWKKTGRHFPEIAEVLKKMQEEKSGD